MQSKLFSSTSSVFHLEHEQVLGENWPASTCSAVVKPNINSTVIEAKCLLRGLWLVPCLLLARCQFWASFHPSSCRTTSTTATGYYIINPCYCTLCAMPPTLFQTRFIFVDSQTVFFVFLSHLLLSLYASIVPVHIFISPLLPLIMYSYRCSSGTSFLNEVNGVRAYQQTQW